MSTKTIDSTAATATSLRRPAKPEGGRKSAKGAKAKPAKKSRQPKAGAHAKARRANKRVDCHRPDETRRGCHADRDHGNHRLAAPHGAGLRFASWQQGRGEDRVREERQRGAYVPHRQVAQLRQVCLQTPLPAPARAAFRP